MSSQSKSCSSISSLSNSNFSFLIERMSPLSHSPDVSRIQSYFLRSYAGATWLGVIMGGAITSGGGKISSSSCGSVAVGSASRETSVEESGGDAS